MISTQHDLPKIIWPTKLSVLLHIVALVAGSQLAMYLDNARGMAYILLPIILASSMLRGSQITWKHHFKTMLALYVLALTWGVVGFMTLAQIISVEDGNPIISSGLIYEITSRMANKPF